MNMKHNRSDALTEARLTARLQRLHREDDPVPKLINALTIAVMIAGTLAAIVIGAVFVVTIAGF